MVFSCCRAPARWLVPLLLVAGLLAEAGAQTISYNGGTLSENFDAMGPFGTNTPPGWFVGWAGGSVTFTTNITVNDGTLAPNYTAGWNFGPVGTSDRALGLMATGSSTPTPPGADRFLEVRIQNNTAQPIGAIAVRYDGEEWRTGSSATQVNKNELQFSADGQNFVSMGSNFQFTQPVFSPISSPLDGNAAANRRANIGGVYALPTPVPSGGLLYLRWYDVNDPASEPGLAMDNFSFAATNLLIAITNQPQTQAALPGSTVTLSVLAGPDITSYQWQKDGIALTDTERVTGAKTATLTLNNFQAADLGVYTVLVRNANAALSSDPATLLFTAPPFQWAQRAGAAGATADLGDGIACDGPTALYVTGQYLSGATLGGTNLSGSGLFLARYTAAGTLEWVRTATSASGAPVGHSLSVDPLGNCYVTGSFDGTTSFGVANLVSAGGSDVFVAKYDRAGTLLWVVRQGGAYDDSGRGIAADGANGCFLTGLLQSSTAASSRDILVAKYNAQGVLQWQRQPASSSSDAGMAVAADDAGNAYVTGWFTSTANFLTTNVTAIGARDIFVAKYNSAGTLLWVSALGGASGDEGKGVGVDTNGNVYVTGSFNIGGGSASSDAEKFLLTKFSSTGALLWQRELLASLYYPDFSSASDRAGNTWVVAGLQGSGRLNGLPVSSTGSYDGLVAKYDPAGTLVWVSQVTGSGSAIPHRLAADGAGHCYLTGEFDGTATFSTTKLTSTGGTDIFVARLGHETPEPLRLTAHRTPALTIDLSGGPGAIVQLQAAETWTNPAWLPVTNLTLTTSMATVTDGNATAQPQKFYRALVMP